MSADARRQDGGPGAGLARSGPMAQSRSADPHRTGLISWALALFKRKDSANNTTVLFERKAPVSSRLALFKSLSAEQSFSADARRSALAVGNGGDRIRQRSQHGDSNTTLCGVGHSMVTRTPHDDITTMLTGVERRWLSLWRLRARSPHRETTTTLTDVERRSQHGHTLTDLGTSSTLTRVERRWLSLWLTLGSFSVWLGSSLFNSGVLQFVPLV